jgi:hypothetical protein
MKRLTISEFAQQYGTLTAALQYLATVPGVSWRTYPRADGAVLVIENTGRIFYGPSGVLKTEAEEF